ncbi:MAG: Asp-tRNA(Asn)/Glu-tRNA(Gln) amidotransferase GatCAB subunit C [Deltaproteobacteria bacterium]|jgi:aspartyl-tRNA(Asn)/glutamyl-tRNA(Gln) amidotransferase subunit C|nr:Asp-tRNA(Asn)/Glu-tRNA(Gln) amidotransferase GatCAB subunit C [Deltaproteobacteria bacterium]
MSRIEPSDVAHVAVLARLALSEDEIAAMTRDLEQILDHVAALDALDTEGVPPTAHGFELATPLRPDRPTPPLDPELAVANAPAREGTAFLVPKVLEEEG